MKRIIIFFLIILLLAGGGLFYYLNFSSETAPTDTATALQVKKVLDEAVVSPVASYNNDSIWYFNSEGRLFEANTDGSNLSEFAMNSFPNGTLVQALWPKTGFDFIVVSRSGTNSVKTYFNSSTKLFTTLAPNIQWLEWLPDGKRVVYIWQADDKKSQQLVIADADGSGFKKVADVFWPDLALKASDDGKTVLMYRTERVGDTNKIYAVNLETAEISTLIDSGNNLAAKWITADKFLYSQPNKILLYNVNSKQSQDLDLNSSLDKIVIDSTSKNLYAVVPVPDGADRIIKLNLDTGKSDIYFEFKSRVNIRSLMMVGNTPYYVDNKDGKLYMISR